MKDHHAENTRLLYGPYRSPKCRVGWSLECEARGRTVIVAGISDAPIQWPFARKRGNRSLILCGNLVNAVAVESVSAICHHWGVSRSVVNSWRRALGVPTNNPGTLRLKRYYIAIGQAASRSPESRAKMSAAHEQRPPCPQFKAAAREAAKKPKSDAWKQGHSERMREQWATGVRQPRGRRA
jgi:hypothetical protein